MYVRTENEIYWMINVATGQETTSVYIKKEALRCLHDKLPLVLLSLQHSTSTLTDSTHLVTRPHPGHAHQDWGAGARTGGMRQTHRTEACVLDNGQTQALRRGTAAHQPGQRGPGDGAGHISGY